MTLTADDKLKPREKWMNHMINISYKVINSWDISKFSPWWSLRRNFILLYEIFVATSSKENFRTLKIRSESRIATDLNVCWRKLTSTVQERVMIMVLMITTVTVPFRKCWNSNYLWSVCLLRGLLSCGHWRWTTLIPMLNYTENDLFQTFIYKVH